jgi:hypothetical protein
LCRDSSMRGVKKQEDDCQDVHGLSKQSLFRRYMSLLIAWLESFPEGHIEAESKKLR